MTLTLTPFIEWPADLILVLASLSPRRADLLHLAGIPYEAVPAPEVELQQAAKATALRADPARYAAVLATAKAEAVAALRPGRLVLGADTIVVLDGRILEKPQNRADAVRILRELSGRRHRVITALTLIGGSALPRWTGSEQTQVEFLPLARRAIERYVATGEPGDKAGAYGIQGLGSLMVRGIEGCFFNVMGLPLALLGEALRQVMGLADHSAGVSRGERDD
jgi:septum formation protein